MAFLARAAMGSMRSGIMKGGMGDTGAGQASEQLKKVKEIQKKLESGGLDIKDIKHLGGDFLKKLEGEGFVGKSGGFEKLGIKPIDLSRNGANEKDGIKLKKPENASEKEISFKSRVNGSFNSIKADYYDKNKLFNTEGVDPVPTYTQEPGLGEVRLEGGPSEGDIKNLGKDPKKDLDTLEKDSKLDKEDTGESELSIDKSFGKKLENVLKVEEQYQRIAGGENTKDIDNLEVAVELGNGLSADSAGSQRISRNIASQNAKKESIKHGSFSQTSTGPSSGVHNPTGGGPKQPKQNAKTGSYDPAKKEVSEGWFKKAIDPFRNLYNKYDEFRNKHEKKFDAADSLNQQANQAAGNIDEVIAGAIMAKAEEQLEEGLGGNVPVGDGGSQNNNNNNNNNDTNSFIGDKIKEKLGFGEKKDHKGSKTTKDVVPHKDSVKGVKGVSSKASVGKSLESENSHHTTGALKELKKEKSTIKDLFSKIHDLKKNNPYVKFVSGVSDQLRYSSSDPVKEILEKFGVAVPFGDDAGQQNNSSGMDDVLSAKIRGEKSKTSKSGSERSKLEHHTNSKVSKVEHHTNVSRLEHSSHNARIEHFKGKTEENTHKKKSEFFDKEVDPTHHVPLKRDNQILEQKEGSSQEKGPNKKHELVEAETALEIEGAEEKAMNGHNIEETITTARTIKNVEEFFNGNDSRDQSEKTEIENAERENRQVGREEQRKDIEEIVQLNELSVKEEEVKTVEEKKREELVFEIMEQRREAVEERGEQEREVREQKEELVAGKMEQRKEAVEDKEREDQEEQKQKKMEREQKEMERERELVARKMEQRREEVEEREDRIRQKKEVIGLKMEQSTEEVEGHRGQRREKSVGELEEIQTNLEEAQLEVEQADQVNQKAAYSEQLQEGERSEGKVVASEEVTAKLERIVQAAEEEGGKKGKIAGSEEVTAKLERIVQADEGLMGRKENEAMNERFGPPPAYSEKERVEVTGKEGKSPSYESLDIQHDRQRSDLREEEAIFSANSRRQEPTDKPPSYESLDTRQDTERPSLKADLSQEPVIMEADAVNNVAAVKAETSEINPASEVENKLQRQLNNSEKFPLNDAIVFEKKSSYSNDARSIGNPVEASVSKEAMLPSDCEMPQRNRRDALIEDKRTVLGHSSGAEAMHHVEHHLDTRVGDHVGHHLDTNVGDHEKQDLGARVGDHVGHHLDTNVGDREKQDPGARVGDHVGHHLDTNVGDRVEQNLGARVEDRIIERHLATNVREQEKRDLDEVKLEDEQRAYFSRAESDQIIRDSGEVLGEQKEPSQRTLEKRSLDQEAQVVETESVTNRTVPVSEISEHTESSEKESETGKAARLEKDNFVSLFTSVAKPGLQTEIARNFGENVYREAKAGKEDIGELTRNIEKNSEKLTKDFTKYLQVEEKRLEAENNISRQWQNEAQIREGIPAAG